ncbi:formate--tetrahydrofolate ligase [Christensenella tenuis]|uniref:Formate--tetrahydrofolate ligase n=1 Tax=Christensenella tenuis TaxID=2763033 RepID=A0ABR7EB35_9FIRM|nr:formate--tetrahydrofolate ligase [Christensenella tenuis]MBC5646966.1 formate--tetrahydrofolate ligase [Christensenella tenuis]
MNNDLKIANSVTAEPILKIAQKLGIPENVLIPYGKDIAKVQLSYLKKLEETRQPGRLILVTAINPTPAGEGKTTVSIGLADALSRRGQKTCLALREPSLGPVFGIKGGATGGGYAQAIPMEDINLHFTGDIYAVTTANNLLCAMIDNHIYHGNELRIDVKNITFKRCMDMNDRALRNIICGLGERTDGVPRQDGFDISAASEIMAVLCLASDSDDLRRRLDRITVAYNLDGQPVFAKDLGAGGAMSVILKEAIKPNLVQTLEHTPVFMHGGPFANIAHGCNSIIATKMANHLADYTVTEAGFGADLGAEKFLDIKCRAADLWPDAVVLVATVRALKYHGGIPKDQLNVENIEAVKKGISNLRRHLNTLKNTYGLPVVVALNHFTTDTQAELDEVLSQLEAMGTKAALCDVWAKGGEGALELADAVTASILNHSSPSHPYDYAEPIIQKITAIATRVYGAERVDFSKVAKQKIAMYEDQGYANLPVCIAKTQYSFSDDPKKLGAPEGFKMDVRDVTLSSGAGFIVVLCGTIMRMPGLPKKPAAVNITLDENGDTVGLF